MEGRQRKVQLEGVLSGQFNVNIEWGVVFENRMKKKEHWWTCEKYYADSPTVTPENVIGILEVW